MKALLVLFVFCLPVLAAQANSPYRNYLLSTVYTYNKPVEPRMVSTPPSPGSLAFLPRFERPRGAVFCRMEDVVTKATKVWLKIGVE